MAKSTGALVGTADCNSSAWPVVQFVRRTRHLFAPANTCLANRGRRHLIPRHHVDDQDPLGTNRPCFLIVLVTMWAATQWVAWKLGYQPQLGPPWFELGEGRPVYVPPAFFWWWYAFDAYAPEIFVEGAGIAASGGILSIVVAFGMSVWRAREAKNAATYGSARGPCAARSRGAGLLGPDGAVLGRSTATISATTVRSTCCALRRRVAARASVW